MKLETDAREHAQAYIHGHTVESPCKVACALIRNLLDDLSAAYGEIRHLKREKAELNAKLAKHGAKLERAVSELDKHRATVALVRAWQRSDLPRETLDSALAKQP